MPGPQLGRPVALIYLVFFPDTFVFMSRYQVIQTETSCVFLLCVPALNCQKHDNESRSAKRTTTNDATKIPFKAFKYCRKFTLYFLFFKLACERLFSAAGDLTAIPPRVHQVAASAHRPTEVFYVSLNVL